MHRQPLLILLVCALLTGCAGGSASTATRPPPTSTATTTTAAPPPTGAPTFENGSLHSDAVNGTLHYEVALPPGYESGAKRYPVVYIQHGLPASDQTSGHATTSNAKFYKQQLQEFLETVPPQSVVGGTP